MKIFTKTVRPDVKIYEVLIYLILMTVYGYIWGYYEGSKKQIKINQSLQTEYNELKTNYDILEIQYKRDLESCYTQLGDYQDKVEAGCFVNGGWNCE